MLEKVIHIFKLYTKLANIIFLFSNLYLINLIYSEELKEFKTIQKIDLF